MNRLQEAFAENGGPVFTLTPGEYEGPLRVDRPCTLDGCASRTTKRPPATRA